MTGVTQSDFRDALLSASVPVPDGMTQPDGSPASRRFNVYRNNVAVGLTEALESAFPVIRKLVGDDFFKAMAGIYLRNHPPSSAVMAGYGDRLPSFLKGFEPVRHLPYLPDMARLELAMRDSYHAGDADPIAPEALAALSPDRFVRARLRLAPSVRLLSSRFPVHGIWVHNTDPARPPVAKGAEDVLITRPHFDPRPRLLTRPAARFVAAIQRGASISGAMAEGGDELDMGALLALLLTDRAIVDIY